jgi:hypothetical protein
MGLRVVSIHTQVGGAGQGHSDPEEGSVDSRHVTSSSVCKPCLLNPSVLQTSSKGPVLWHPPIGQGIITGPVTVTDALCEGNRHILSLVDLTPALESEQGN